MGAGRTEFAMSLFGQTYGSKIKGKVFLRGKEIKTRTVAEAIENGIAYATEDRKTYGLNLIEDIKPNISMASLRKLEKYGLVHDNEEYRGRQRVPQVDEHQGAERAREDRQALGRQPAEGRAAQWIYSDPDVLILDEPTRGIDVGAKYEIYTIINKLAAGRGSS